jgi:hypothetical protein
MDGGQIEHMKLFVTNVVAMNIPFCFTKNILKIETLNYDTIRQIVIGTAENLAEKGIMLSGVICDGASYQVKALDFAFTGSLQASGDENVLMCLLYIPCLCHKLNNSYHALYRECQAFHTFINSLCHIGKTCRKPAYKTQFRRFCPDFIETR